MPLFYADSVLYFSCIYDIYKQNGQYINPATILDRLNGTPLPKLNDGKMVHFGLQVASSLIKGEGGISVPFYSVQDCSSNNTACDRLSPGN